MHMPSNPCGFPLAAAVAAMSMGCYTYQPAIRPVPATGASVQVTFDPPRAVALLPSDRADSLSGVRWLNGETLEARGDTLVLGKLAAFGARGDTLGVGADAALVPRTAPGVVVRTRQISVGRTSALVVVTLGVLGFIAYQLAQPFDITIGLPAQ